MNRRTGSMVRLAFLSIAAMVALLAVAWSTSFQGAPSAQAVDGASLNISKTCSPEQVVGGVVQYSFILTNTGSVALDQDSVVDDPNLGDISAAFPDHLEPGQSASATKWYFVQEDDPRPLENTVTATYYVAGDTAAVVAEDTCSVNVPHLTITKTATFSDTSTTFTFTLTNDGNGVLVRFRVIDDVLGNISSLFPFVLSEGQTVVRQKTIDRLECQNTVTAAYQSASGFAVVDKDKCTPDGERGSIHLTKVKEVGPFTVPTLVCFRLDLFDGGVFVPAPDPPEGAEQCLAPDASGEATFWWTDLRFGDYQVVETLEVCEVQGVEENPCTRYSLLPPIPVTISQANPTVTLGPFANDLFPGELCFKKVDKDGNPWPGPDVEFTVDSLTDPVFVPIVKFIPSDVNFDNSVCIFPLPEGTYEVCETPPANFSVEPSVCQSVDVIAGDVPAPITLTFKNIPTDGEGCTPGFWRNKNNGRKLWDEATDAIPIAIGLALGIDPAVVAAIDSDSDFYAVFMVAPETAGLPADPFTTDDAIRLGGGGAKKLTRHGMAALLNAAGVNYPKSITEVKDIVKAALITGNFEPLATELDGLNNLSPDCPANNN